MAFSTVTRVEDLLKEERKKNEKDQKIVPDTMTLLWWRFNEYLTVETDDEFQFFFLDSFEFLNNA